MLPVQRVDLAVVRDEAVRVRERPRRERVGAEALVHERERRLEVRVGQVGKHRPDLVGGQHALVDQRVGTTGCDVERLLRSPSDRQRVDRVLDPLADDVELALERASRHRRRRRPAPRPMKTWRNAGSTATALGPTRRVVGRHVAPAEQGLAFFGDDRARTAPRRRAAPRVVRQEHQPTPYSPAGGSATPARPCAGTGPGIWIRMPAPSPVLASQPHAPRCARLISTWSACCTMRVRLAALDVDDEADAAGVVLVARVVQNLVAASCVLLRRPGIRQRGR